MKSVADKIRQNYLIRRVTCQVFAFSVLRMTVENHLSWYPAVSAHKEKSYSTDILNDHSFQKLPIV